MIVPVCDRPSLAEPTKTYGRLVMESESGNAQEIAVIAIASSPLPALPIRQVMGVAHYLPQPTLPEMPGCSARRVAGRATGRIAAGAVFSCRLHFAGSRRRN